MCEKWVVCLVSLYSSVSLACWLIRIVLADADGVVSVRDVKEPSAPKQWQFFFPERCCSNAKPPISLLGPFRLSSTPSILFLRNPLHLITVSILQLSVPTSIQV
ncbi:MAG: hypothetical protein BYD32DRAFT_137988 [Podila humilis]|nr:MAG: hypothetical protein BYD32DRAFT_137988 [Podila humilis]